MYVLLLVFSDISVQRDLVGCFESCRIKNASRIYSSQINTGRPDVVGFWWTSMISTRTYLNTAKGNFKCYTFGRQWVCDNGIIMALPRQCERGVGGWGRWGGGVGGGGEGAGHGETAVHGTHALELCIIYSPRTAWYVAVFIILFLCPWSRHQMRHLSPKHLWWYDVCNSLNYQRSIRWCLPEHL